MPSDDRPEPQTGYRSCRRTRRVLKLRDPLSGSTSAGAIGRGRPSMHSKDADSDASSLDCASQAAERCDDSASREQGLASQTLSNTADRQEQQWHRSSAAQAPAAQSPRIAHGFNSCEDSPSTSDRVDSWEGKAVSPLESSLGACSASEAASAHTTAADKAGRALQLMAEAAAVQLHASSPVSRKRRSSSRGQRYVRGPVQSLVGARISVFWPQDSKHQQGVITAVDEQHRHHVRYDNDHSEWLLLPDERFSWIGPRALSAGCAAAVRDCMVDLGSEDIVPTARASLPCAVLPHLTGQGACGWQLGVYFLGTGSYVQGQVVAFSSATGRHHVAYHDGEDEWVNLQCEALQWHQQADRLCLTLPDGQQVPDGPAAVGWQVAVYDEENQLFFCATITAYLLDQNCHELRPASGKALTLDLSSTKIKWLAAPTSPPTHWAHRRQQTEATDVSSPRGSFTSSCQGPQDLSPAPQRAQQLLPQHKHLTTPCHLPTGAHTGAEDLLELPPSPSMLCLSELLSSQSPHLPPAPISAVPPTSQLLTWSLADSSSTVLSPPHSSHTLAEMRPSEAEADSEAVQFTLAPLMSCSASALPDQLDAESATWPLTPADSSCRVASLACGLGRHPSSTLDAFPEMSYLNLAPADGSCRVEPLLCSLAKHPSSTLDTCPEMSYLSDHALLLA